MGGSQGRDACASVSVPDSVEGGQAAATVPEDEGRQRLHSSRGVPRFRIVDVGSLSIGYYAAQPLARASGADASHGRPGRSTRAAMRAETWRTGGAFGYLTWKDSTRSPAWPPSTPAARCGPRLTPEITSKLARRLAL